MKMSRSFSYDLFSAFYKLVSFLYILLKKDKDTEQNANLAKHIKEQMEFIKFDEIICSTIKLIKNCPDDFINLKYDIMTRLRTLILCKRDTNQQTFEKNKS